MKKTESITFRCSIELKKILDTMAKNEDRSVSYIINKILEKNLLETNQEGRE